MVGHELVTHEHIINQQRSQAQALARVQVQARAQADALQKKQLQVLYIVKNK